MADTYEKDLGQKSSLTVNDYIRVVGSDNASYKQLVSDVAKKIIENYTNSSLGGSNRSVKNAIDSLNNNWHINLVAGQDLNGITGRGFYDCPTSTIAQSLVNCPTTNNFVMQTMTKGAYCTQIIFTGDKMFLRTQVSSGWGSWYMFTATAV